MKNYEEVNALIALGFTEMEATVYVSLLSESPLTGYRIAKNLGKPPAYVYRVLDSLQKKGAILVDEGDKRDCRAVPYPELLSQLGRDFEQKRKNAADRLKKLTVSDLDNKVYQLSTVNQVIERARTMIDDAETHLFLDAFPVPLDAIRGELEAAHDRGVRVGIRQHDDTIVSADVSTLAAAGGIIQDWPRQWLRVSVDGSQSLTALFNQDGSDIYQAVWTSSPMISWIDYYCIGLTVLWNEIKTGLESDSSLDELKSVLSNWKATFKEIPEFGAAKMQMLFDTDISLPEDDQ